MIVEDEIVLQPGNAEPSARSHPNEHGAFAPGPHGHNIGVGCHE